MKKRIGIIGFGWIARDVHTPYYKTIEDMCEITAVCDIDPKAIENAKEKTGLSDDRIFTDYKELIDSGLCDAVDICTPNYLHCEIAKYALNAGLPVSIEKPVGMNAQEVEEVKLLSEEKVCLFSSASHGVTDPPSDTLRICLTQARSAISTTFISSASRIADFGRAAALNGDSRRIRQEPEFFAI